MANLQNLWDRLHGNDKGAAEASQAEKTNSS